MPAVHEQTEGTIMAMSESDYRASHPDDPSIDKEKKPLFVPNGGGMGYHPASLAGWLILLGIVVVILCVILLAKGVI